MNITELKEQVNNLNLLNKFNNLIGYGISTKIVDGIDSGELCVKFFVEDKIHTSQLTEDQIIPNNLKDIGVDIITDVVKAQKKGIPTLQVKNNKQLNQEEVSPLTYEEAVQLRHSMIVNRNDNDTVTLSATTQKVYYFNDPDVYVQALDETRRRYRPLKTGTSSMFSTQYYMATMGLIVTDALDGSPVALSNNHVYADSQLCGRYARAGANLNTLNLSAIQPAVDSRDYRSLTNEHIGIHKRCVAITDDNNNKVDCAIVQLANYNLIDSTSTEVIGFKFKGPHTFATTAEIDSLLDSSSPNYQAPIFRCGRTLGPMGYPGNEYSKEIDKSVKSTGITAIPLPDILKNDPATKLTYYPWIDTYSNFSYDNGIIVAKLGTDIYWSGIAGYTETFFGYWYYERFIPNPVETSHVVIDIGFGAPRPYPNDVETPPFTKIGSFDYFTVTGINTVGNAGTIGLSAGTNKLVYFGKLFRDMLETSSQSLFWGGRDSIVDLVPNDYTNVNAYPHLASSKYQIFPSQLPSYDGLKKIVATSTSLFLLKNKELYSIGVNRFNGGSIGYGKFGDYSTTWTRVPGDWDDIYVSSYGQTLLALSAGNFFRSSGAQYTNPTTHTYNLAANKLGYRGNFKKIFSPEDNCHPNPYFIGLSTNNVLVGFKVFDEPANTYSFYHDYPVIYKGIWSEDIKILPYNYNTDIILLSGTKVYTVNAGMFTEDGYNSINIFEYNKIYKPTSDFFTGATKRYSYNEFSQVLGVNVNDIGGTKQMTGYYTDTDYTDAEKTESIIFLSAGNWYCAGYNRGSQDTRSGAFGLFKPVKDELVVDALGLNVKISYDINGKGLTFTDCLQVSHKEYAYPTSQGGDSGTAVFALLSANIPTLSAWKVIGLIYAGDITMTTESGAIICRIDNIVDKLKIKEWDGTIPTAKSTIQNVVYNSDTNTIPTITLSGRQYFNIGIK